MEVTRDLSLREVIKNPNIYEGMVVLWGGVIIDSKNLKEGTRITVLQKDLNRWGRPRESDRSQGRFIVLYPGYRIDGEDPGNRIGARGGSSYSIRVTWTQPYTEGIGRLL